MGGAETWLMEVLRLWSQDESAPEMDFLITSGVPGLFDDEARRLGARIHYVPFGRHHLPTFVRSFRAVLRDGHYAAIHDHQGPVAGMYLMTGTGVLPPVRVVHLHNPLPQFEAHYGVSFLRRTTLALSWRLAERLATEVRATSQSVLDSFPSSAPETPRAPLYCGIRPERFLGDPAEARDQLCKEFRWPPEVKILLFAGRIDRSPDSKDPLGHKNAPLAVEIAMACCQRDPSVRMILAGAPSEAVPILEQRIADAGLSGQIIFAGIRSDIETLMLGSHVQIFPSRVEGLGMVAVEAQAAGLPVIASTAVPHECVVVDGLVDFLSLDAPLEVWTEAVRGRLAQERRRPDASNRSVQDSAFSIANSAKALETMYRRAT